MNNELSQYRLSEAKEKLEAAIILKYKDSVSRSYYAMFSAARALLAFKNLDSSRHSGIISLFNLHFVKNDIIDKECGKLLAKAKDIREEGDYGDFVIVSREEEQNGVRFIHHVLTWGFVLFIIVHTYLAFWNDIVYKEGAISSIVSGNVFEKSD